MTLRYSLMQISYWIMFCCIYIFANPYLSARGFSVSEIGILISLSSLISVFMQPVIAKILDKKANLTVNLVLIFMISSIAISIIFVPFVTSKLMISLLMVIAILGIYNSQTFIYTFIFEYINSGFKVNFGLARGLGSVSFSIVAYIFGYIGQKRGFGYIPYLGFVLSLIVLLIIASFDTKIIKHHKVNRELEDHLTTYQFFKKYTKFFYLLIGVCLLFLGHNALVVFFKNIIESVNGKISDIGLGLTIASAVELPVMGAFTYLNKKIKIHKLFFIAAIGFSVKLSVLLVGIIIKSRELVLFSQLLQIFAFAIYLPTSVYYVNHIMEVNDRIKGQAYLGTFLTIGAILGNFLTGTFLEFMSVSLTYTIMLVISIIGTLLICINLEK